MSVSDHVFPSQNEWASLGEKAARGAGYDWGYAEEFGWALAELAAQGIDASQDLCHVLSAYETGQAVVPRCLADLAPDLGRGALCPVSTGAALCDFGEQAIPDGRLALGLVQSPVFLLPFTIRLSQVLGRNVQLCVGDRPVGGDIIGMAQADVSLTLGDGDALQRSGGPNARIAIDADAFDQLKSYGMRTTVPATEQSRASGAGAGLTDND